MPISNRLVTVLSVCSGRFLCSKRKSGGQEGPGVLLSWSLFERVGDGEERSFGIDDWTMDRRRHAAELKVKTCLLLPHNNFNP